MERNPVFVSLVEPLPAIPIRFVDVFMAVKRYSVVASDQPFAKLEFHNGFLVFSLASRNRSNSFIKHCFASSLAPSRIFRMARILRDSRHQERFTAMGISLAAISVRIRIASLLGFRPYPCNLQSIPSHNCRTFPQ